MFYFGFGHVKGGKEQGIGNVVGTRGAQGSSREGALCVNALCGVDEASLSLIVVDSSHSVVSLEASRLDQHGLFTTRLIEELFDASETSGGLALDEHHLGTRQGFSVSVEEMSHPVDGDGFVS